MIIPFKRYYHVVVVAENQIKLEANIFTPDIIIGLRSDTLSNIKKYFYFLVADIKRGLAKQRKYSQK